MHGLTMRHMKVLFRTEWKLFHRIKANYIFVVFVPLMILMAMSFVHDQMDLGQHGLDAGPVMVATAAGILLNPYSDSS
ncbi:hypothetical protein [Streptomyces sp. NPDC054961]